MWFSVRARPDGFHVFDRQNRQIAGPYLNKGRAVTRAKQLVAKMERRAAKTQRPCMCCGKTFESAGKHNRLCSNCGRSGIDTGLYGIGSRPTSTSGARR